MRPVTSARVHVLTALPPGCLLPNHSGIRINICDGRRGSTQSGNLYLVPGQYPKILRVMQRVPWKDLCIVMTLCMTLSAAS